MVPVTRNRNWTANSASTQPQVKLDLHQQKLILSWPVGCEGRDLLGKPCNAISPSPYNCAASNCNVWLKQLYKNVQN